MEQQNEYIEIDLLRLLRAVWRHMALVVLAAILCGGAAFAAARYLVPVKYQASTLLYVNNSAISVGSTSISLSDLSASQSLVETYIVILNTRLTLNEVVEKAGVDYSFTKMKKMVEAEALNGTEIFEVTVTSRDAEEAARIANTIARILPDKIAQIVDGSSVRTVDWAVVPEKPYSPSSPKYAVIGALAGLLLSVGAVVLRELMDDQIHSEEDLLQTYSLPLLAMETDLRLPTICKRLGLEVRHGLSNLLAGLCEEGDVLQPSGIHERLTVMGAGAAPPNPSELLGSDQMKTLLKGLSGSFDFIVLDLPPVNEVSDALVASRLAHGIVMVVRQGYATRSSVAEAMRQLDHVSAKVGGFVMTHADVQDGRAYQRGKYRYSYSAAAKKGSGT